MNQNNDKNEELTNEKGNFRTEDYYILPSNKGKPYRRRKDEEKKAISWGQRKLLLTLIQFITLFWKPSKIKNPKLVYAGAAPGINIKIVSEFFPEVEFFLYDPRGFKVKKSDKIHVYQKKFTDKIAREWAEVQEREGNIFLMSDIRTADYTKCNSLDQNEEQIWKDMDMQRRWVQIIKPVKAHLKFRLPYTGGNRPDSVKYFPGFIFVQPYAPQTTTETRLVPYSYELIDWSCEKYQSQLFYHNTVVREKFKYKNPLDNSDTYVDEPELIDDFDSVCEVNIWKDYLKFRRAEVTKENVVSLSRLSTHKLTNRRKFQDSLHFLRKNPRAIKERNMKVKKSRDDM